MDVRGLPPPAPAAPPIASTQQGVPAIAAPRRLLTIAHSYVVGVNRRLAHEMTLAGKGRWDVTAVAPSYFHGGGDLRPVNFEPLGNEPYRIEVIKARRTRFVHLFSYDRRLKRVLAEPWDMVHAWEEPYIVVGYQIARWTQQGVPLVYRTAQSLYKQYPPPFSWMERYNMARASGWICSGSLVAETLGARRMYQSKPMRLIPLGVDTDFYKPDPQGAARTFTELGWDPQGPPVIGYLGRFVTAKGLHMLTEVLDELRMPWRALFVGAGPMEHYLKQWGERHEGRVRVCTNVHHVDVPRYFGVMNMMVAPSQTARNWREQFGRMLIESFACGVPVVGSDSGEIPYVIGDAGMICGEHDHHAWVRTLRMLLGSPEKRAELTERGIQRAHQLYAWPIIAREYLSFFDELLERRTK